ncbi:MAG TPA: NADH-ubiquinone oxidoreductase-F iron-sulfur binding region domain-containing protein [Solirubrobacteraceae bacterium]|jgi:NADH:ubiquinone oxidoreductase subunit F (NADH-binding)|nr:NADH-ubiquinone oxidoreductase-F iron-sulfur binding region domain-containing protein [Solirubrobacteraceae bacterium]
MSALNSTLTEPLAPMAQQCVPALPRVLYGVPSRGALSLEEHVAIHGTLPSTGGRGRRRARERATMLIEEIERSGLLGHGGAAFPTAAKMRAVAGARRRAIVVVNAAEGEPASRKDRTLLETLPHLVLDGGVLAAEAVGADEVIVCICESADLGIESLTRAVEERVAAGSGHSPSLHLVVVPAHYVAGQESALVNYLNGGPARPTFTPPMPFEQGVKHRPTLVHNAETLAHIALIARHGAPWFRQLGTPSQPGSTLVTLSGPLTYPGVYEIEHGASLSSLVQAAGGTTARLRGALLGGYAGSWVHSDLLSGIALSNEHLAPYGASLGAGVVLLLSEHACPVAETVRLAGWLAGQSTRQCGPCAYGLDALAMTVLEIAGGIAQARAKQRVEHLASLTARRGACSHPDGAVNLILSSLETFEAEFAEHARHGPCDGCARPPEMPMPYRAVSQCGSRGTRR